MKTIGSIATLNKGRTTGFDYLRLGLALAVVCTHALGGTDQYWSNWMKDHRPLVALILPAFFSLSGFLVVGSLFRNSIPEFVALRIIRLVPALAFEVTLSALLIGPVFTSLSLSEYFFSHELFLYFLNIVGEIHYFLPGVFYGEPVNAQLWTIPYELKCYAILIFFALLLLLPIKRFFPIFLVFGTVLLTAFVCYRTTNWSDWHPSGPTLIISFLWGCAIYLFRDRVSHSLPLTCVAIGLAIIILINPRFETLAALPVAYATVCVGLLALPAIRFGDLSYGIFLFHLPVLQTLRYEAGIKGPWALLVTTLLLSGVCAMISWNLIENPIISRKNEILGRVRGAASYPFLISSKWRNWFRNEG